MQKLIPQLRNTSGLILASLALTVGAEQKKIEEVLVTAQRTSENIQVVPIAVTAFGDELLKQKQVRSANTLQFHVPNLTYSDTGTGSPNFTIRGVGASSSTISGADAGVGIHINDVYINSGYAGGALFDTEQVSVLRGPQGTLYGRNSTGGAINITTRRPTEAVGGYLEVRHGSFNNTTIEGVINLPISEKVGFRLATLVGKSDGYTKNEFTGNDINGDDFYMLRPTLSLAIFENSTLDIIGSYLNSDDDSLGFDKMACTRDESTGLGCLPGSRGTDAPNSLATIGGIGLLFTGATDDDPFADAINPTDGFKTHIDLEPESKAEIFGVTFDFEHETEKMTFNSISSVLYTRTSTLRDNDNLVGTSPFNFPIELSAASEDLSGAFGGNIYGTFTNAFGYDALNAEDRQFVQEFRVLSSYDGPSNFLLGAFYLKSDFNSKFMSATTGLDAYGLLLEDSGVSNLPPYIYDENYSSDVESYAVFGEYYYQFNDDLKLTLGIRWTHDQKFADKRTLAFAGELVDGVSTIEDQGTRTLTKTFTAPTGRVTVDWQPNVSFTDASLFYATYSRGYRSGGINNASSSGSDTFKPEHINAFELGSKNLFLDSTGQLNLSMFYYDYLDYQIDENGIFNVDAVIYGAEVEYSQYLSDNLQINLNLSYLQTQVNEGESINRRDPTAGDASLVTLGDIEGKNCVIGREQFEAPSSFGGFGNDAYWLALIGESCESNSFGAPFSAGKAVSLKDKELPNSPEMTVSLGLEHSTSISDDHLLTTRLDYYWQPDFYGRIFNDGADEIASWQVLNFYTDLRVDRDVGYFVRFGISNLLNNDYTTGLELRGPEAGLATNLFLLEPRNVNLTIGAQF
jgi:outer membrane receptor protein involved in Fe transport